MIFLRLPDAGQIIPTPEPHERVVFLAHFVRGLGFPLHPFISAFIIVCGAFFRIKPHFGLWLKTFNVKPTVVVG